MPKQFLAKIQEIYPGAAAGVLATMLSARRSTVRINPLKTDLVTLRRRFIEERVKFQELGFPRGAFILNYPLRDFQRTAIYCQGLVYVQNVSSMIPPLALMPANQDKVLDLCAAPGAKTTQLVSLAPQAEFIAVEKSRIRYYKLLANLSGQGIRWRRPPDRLSCCDDEGADYPGAAGTLVQAQVSGNEPIVTVYLMDGIWVRKKFPEYFTKILLDAPCSCEGRFDAFNLRTFKYWREQKVKEMVHTQKKLINAAFSALAENGEMVYSTCTFSPEENESLIDWFLNKFKGKIELLPMDLPLANSFCGLTSWRGRRFCDSIKLTRRIMPNDHMEGFFVAKMKKISL